MRNFIRFFIVAAIATVVALPATANARQLYTNLYTDAKIAALNIGTDGSLSSVSGSPFTVASYLQMFTITPDARFILAGFPWDVNPDNFVIPYPIGADGGIGAAGTQLNANIAGPMVVAPSGNALYSGMDDGSIGAFTIAADGAMTPLGTTGAGSTNDIAVTPDGRYLFAADYSTPTIQRFAIGVNGALTALAPAAAPLAQAETMKLTPNGRVLILTSDPGGTGSTVSFLVGPDGSLTSTGQSIANTDTSVRHGAITPNGQFYFVPNSNAGSVSILQVGANGELTRTLPDVPTAHTDVGEAVASVDGRFLFVLARDSDFVQTFAIGTNGALTPLTPTVPTGGDSDGSTPTPRPAQAPITKLKIKAAEPGQLSRFDATGSADTDGGTVTSYSWNFGDGTSTTSTGPKVSHRYKKAGDYDVSAVAVDNENCGGSDIFDGNIMYCNAGAESTASSKLDTPPAITRLRTSPKRFKRGKGTRVLYTLSEKARVTFTVQKPTIGRKVGKSCRKTTSKNRSRKRCVRYVKVKNGTFRANGKRGSNKFKFSGKLKKRSLAMGRYRLQATATDSRKGRSIAKSTKFSVR